MHLYVDIHACTCRRCPQVLGKFFAALVMLIGYGLIAVPTLIGTVQTHKALSQALLGCRVWELGFKGEGFR